MIPTVPQIGFDRFIQLDWVAAALKVRAGMASLDELNELLDAAGLGKEAKVKTRTKLNALALEPRADLVDFVARGVQLFKGTDDPASWLHLHGVQRSPATNFLGELQNSLDV
jgi:hypothetical protein